jgi:DNA-binding NtrC family response regulator
LRNDSGDASKANASDAGAGISGGEVGDAESGDPIGTLVGRRLDEVTDELVLRTLQRHNGNRTKTAEVLGIGVRTLFNRLRELQQESPS